MINDEFTEGVKQNAQCRIGRHWAFLFYPSVNAERDEAKRIIFCSFDTFFLLHLNLYLHIVF